MLIYGALNTMLQLRSICYIDVANTFLLMLISFFVSALIWIESKWNVAIQVLSLPLF